MGEVLPKLSSAEPNSQCPYSVKIERTAKGARFSVHVFAGKKQEAMDEAVAMYVTLGKVLEAQGQTVAPIEKGSKAV